MAKFEKFTQLLDNANNKIEIAKYNFGKYKPLIEVVGGITCFVGAAATAFKAHKELDLLNKEVETRRLAGEDVRSGEVLIRGAKIMAPTAVLTVAGGLLITDSYRTLMGRIGILSSSLATLSMENARYKQYIAEHHPEVPTEVPVGQIETTVEDEDGNKHVIKTDVIDASSMGTFERFYFHKSSLFESGDLMYNQMMISSKEQSIYNKLMTVGAISVNDVYDIFEQPIASDLDRRKGAILGWTDSSSFSTTQVAMSVYDPDLGGMVNTIKVSFDVPPTYIYASNRQKDSLEYVY